MIETPTTTAIIPTAPDSDILKTPGAIPNSLVQQDLLFVRAKPITSSAKGTLKHLRASGGRLSRFRAFPLLMIYGFLAHNLASFVAPPSTGPIPRSLAMIATATVLCRVNLAWTHMAISTTSSKSAWSRIVGGHEAKRIVGPTFLNAAVQQSGIIIPVLMLKTLHLDKYIMDADLFRGLAPAARTIIVAQFLTVGLLTLLYAVLIMFPAHITFRRIQASLLPDDDETIIHFDRNFGGRVIPQLAGGNGRVTIRDAWATFEWSALFNVVKIFVRMLALFVAVSVLFFVILAIELRLVVGDRFDDKVGSGLKAFRAGL